MCLRRQKNHDFTDFGLKGKPLAAKNHDFTNFGLKGGDNIDILSGSEVFYFFIFSTPPGGSEL